MIFDKINSLTTNYFQKYSLILCQAFDWIKAVPSTSDHGIFELQGNLFYVNVHGYDTLPSDQCVWESHRHTVDIQYCISGGEIVEWMPKIEMPCAGDYNPEKDTDKWLDTPGPRVSLTMQPGLFAMFLPHELHRPKIFDGINSHIEKLVVKIDAELLGL